MGFKAKVLRFMDGTKKNVTYRVTIPKAIADIMELDKIEYLDLDFKEGKVILSKGDLKNDK